MKIKELIDKKLLISKRAFEKQVGVSRQTLYSIQNGSHKPSELTIKKICNYFGVDYKEYLD